MGTGPGQILGSRVDGTSQRVYMMDITPEGAVPISGTVNLGLGSIIIGSVSANVDLGSIFIIQDIPTAGIQNNPKWAFEYDDSGNVGSVYQMIGIGSYVNVLAWAGFSGTLPGTGSRVTNISAWSVV